MWYLTEYFPPTIENELYCFVFFPRQGSNVIGLVCLLSLCWQDYTRRYVRMFVYVYDWQQVTTCWKRSLDGHGNSLFIILPYSVLNASEILDSHDNLGVS